MSAGLARNSIPSVNLVENDCKLFDKASEAARNQFVGRVAHDVDWIRWRGDYGTDFYTRQHLTISR